jgi:hypothetical protein
MFAASEVEYLYRRYHRRAEPECASITPGTARAAVVIVLDTRLIAVASSSVRPGSRELILLRHHAAQIVCQSY